MIRRCPSAVPPPWLPMAGMMTGLHPSAQVVAYGLEDKGKVCDPPASRGDCDGLARPDLRGKLQRAELPVHFGRDVFNACPVKRLPDTQHSRKAGCVSHGSPFRIGIRAAVRHFTPERRPIAGKHHVLTGGSTSPWTTEAHTLPV